MQLFSEALNPAHCFQSFASANAVKPHRDFPWRLLFEVHEPKGPRRFCGERPLMGVCLKTMAVIGILSLSSRSTLHISVSIISLTQMISCAETRTDAESRWLNHKVTQMRELIGLAIMMCVKWAPRSLWHQSIKILLKFCLWFAETLSWQLLHGDWHSHGVRALESDRSGRLTWASVRANWYLSEEWN